MKSSCNDQPCVVLNVMRRWWKLASILAMPLLSPAAMLWKALLQWMHGHSQRKKKWSKKRKRHIVRIKERKTRGHNYRRKGLILFAQQRNYFKNLGRKRMQKRTFCRLKGSSFGFKPKRCHVKRARSTCAASSVAKHAALLEINLKRPQKKKPVVRNWHLFEGRERERKKDMQCA